MTATRLLTVTAALLLTGELVSLEAQNPPPIVVRAARPIPVQPNQPPAAPVDPALSDKQALAAAGLKAEDPEGLLNYLRQRTLSDVDLSRIQAVIRRLGADDFEERLKAAREVESFGPAAIGPLRTAAESDPDYEVLYRAGECLKRMEMVPHADVAGAVVRELARSRPPGTAAALLAFLPLADNGTVVDAIRSTLTAVALRDGKADPALVAALADAAPVRRAAAAVALVQGGPATERIHIPDAYPAVLKAAAVEKDVETRFQMVHALLTVAREKAVVAGLIELLPDLPRGRLWQAEDYLIQLAGADAPKATFGRTRETLEKARDAWKAWWERSAAKTDLTAFSYTPRVAGKTVLVLMDFRFGNSGMILELGPDLKEQWKIGGLASPMDAQFLPDGTLAIAEHNSNRVTIRDTGGRVISARTIGGGPNRVFGNPQQVQVLENGNLLVVCRNVIIEFKKDKDEEVMRYVRNQYDITAARRLASGQTLVLFQNQANPQNPMHTMFLDEKGKEIPDKRLKTGMPYYQAHIDSPSADRVLITELNQVVEYDLKTGKPVWTKAVNQPRSVQRLPNGNTLLVDAGSNRLLEVTPDGEEVWSYAPTSGSQNYGLQIFRGYRR
jgi:hypothetical protein